MTPVVWGQALAAFVIWIAYGFYLLRRQPRMTDSARRLSARQVMVRSLAWLLGGSLASLGLLAAVGLLGGVREARLVPWGLAVAVVAGLTFVHSQTVAAVLMVVGSSSRRTPGPSDTSES
ncbi:MAG: hypothetical protein AB7F50_04895 [Fimbriimonadaceae bacterium]